MCGESLQIKMETETQWKLLEVDIHQTRASFS